MSSAVGDALSAPLSARKNASQRHDYVTKKQCHVSSRDARSSGVRGSANEADHNWVFQEYQTEVGDNLESLSSSCSSQTSHERKKTTCSPTCTYARSQQYLSAASLRSQTPPSMQINLEATSHDAPGVTSQERLMTSSDWLALKKALIRDVLEEIKYECYNIYFNINCNVLVSTVHSLAGVY